LHSVSGCIISAWYGRPGITNDRLEDAGLDAELNRRWLSSEPPFDGVTIHTPDFVPVSELRLLLLPVLDVLTARFGDSLLLRNADWHEHDGYVSSSSPISWSEIHSLLASDKALLAACESDTYVRLAVFPEDREFLLRIYVPDVTDNSLHEHDDPNLVRYGMVDLSGDGSFVASVAASLSNSATALVAFEPSKLFFDRRQA